MLPVLGCLARRGCLHFGGELSEYSAETTFHGPV